MKSSVRAITNESAPCADVREIENHKGDEVGINTRLAELRTKRTAVPGG